jgi:inositol phosphorylceramide synthase catalytic subunit
LFVAHLAIMAALGKAGPIHWIADGIGVTLALARPSTARVVRTLIPLWVVLVLYFDVLPVALKYRLPVHVGDLYEAELRWFGVETAAGRVIPCDLFRDRHWPVLDIALTLDYLGYQVPSVVYTLLLFRYDRRRMRMLLVAFCLTHIAGFATYVLYPAAPPWYVEKYGVGEPRFDVGGEPAGMARFDELLGVDVAHGFYRASSNVFGAMPSLHVGLATLFPLVTWGMRKRWVVPGVIHLAATSFGAVYFRHHYILDLLLGMFYGAVAVAIAAWLVRPTADDATLTAAPAAGVP